MNKSFEQSKQRSKVNNLFAHQVYSGVLLKKTGVSPCCPSPNPKREQELYQTLQAFEYYYPENPLDIACEYSECQEKLLENINIL